VNVNGNGPTGLVRYYYTRQRVEFQSTAISSVAATGGTATISGVGDATKIQGQTTTTCNGCTFTATVVDSASGDAMELLITDTGGGTFYDAPGDLDNLDSGNLTVVGE
jgi:hypothetical protein